MKIAFVVFQFPCLSETFILNQITGLIDRGHEIDIYAIQPQPISKVHADVEKYKLLNRTHYLKPPAHKVERLVKAVNLIFTHFLQKPMVILKALNFFKYGKNALSLTLLYKAAPLLTKKNYDIIHCHFGPNGYLGLLLKEIGAVKGKVVVSFHGYDATWYPERRGRNVYEALFREADFFTVNSNFIGQRIIELGCSENKIIKLPESLKVTEFVCQERYLLSGSPVQLLTVARLAQKKGLEYSIQAVAKVLEKHPNVKYLIAGDGPLRSDLQALIEQLGVEDKVVLLGWRDQTELQQLYAKAHIFMLSSVTANHGDQEGQGLVLQEAQAMGLPVVSTLHNGIPEGVVDGQSAFLVPEKDVTALAEKLIYLIEHPEIWPTMGRIGREFVEKHYDTDKLNDRLIEIYRKLST